MSGRRDFLKGLAGGVVAGFPTIIPSSALGRDGYVAPSEKIVLGAVGVGRQGSGDMRGFLTQPDVHVAAICDVNQATRERIATVVNSAMATPPAPNTTTTGNSSRGPTSTAS